MKVILLHREHRHVSATLVTFFRLHCQFISPVTNLDYNSLHVSCMSIIHSTILQVQQLFIF